MNVSILYDAQRKKWLKFATPVEIIHTFDSSEVLAKLQLVERMVNERQLHAAGFISYESAPAFDSALHVRGDNSLPLLLFGLYETYEPFHLPSPVSGPPLLWQPTVSRKEYDESIERIKNYILEGDTYQVNYSFRLQSQISGEPFELFQQLVDAQQSGNGAYIETDDFAVCSASPELFFSLDGENIITRPMKGTAPRGLTLSHDTIQAEALLNSEKNRAENLMIVDMIRNDLGRVAEVGSVHVASLFDVERYPTVWQMTSTVEARTKASVAEIVKALFPCASVTGAPKVRTMEIIEELESTPRRIYTGATGFITPNRKAQFNVAIRTVLIDKKRNEAEYGVGGGIVWASTAEGEYDECLTKATVLTEVRPKFELFETMLFTRREGFFLFDEHLARLKDSAEYFGLPFDEASTKKMSTELQQELCVFDHDSRVRLVLQSDGSPTFSIKPFVDASLPVRIALSQKPVDSKNLFLYHKTTHRKAYDDAFASVGDCDDVILWNERGEITESTIANVVVEIGEELFTPPIQCGLLAGTLRARLLNEGKIKELVIKKEELKNATRVFLINSVRKWLEANVDRV